MNTTKLWNELKRICSELFMKEWEWRTLTIDPQKTSPNSFIRNSASARFASQVDQPSTEELERSSKSTQSPNNLLNILIFSRSLVIRFRSLRQLLMMMDGYVHHTILPVLQREDFPHPSLNSELEEISKMLKNLSDQSLSLTQDINSVRLMLNPESPSASAQSNGTSSKTGDI